MKVSYNCLTDCLALDPDLLLADVVVPQAGPGPGRREPGRAEAEQQLAGEENIFILRKYFSLSCPQVRPQSQSMVRGEHPFMAFMLPSVSLSEAGSETDSLSVSSEQDQAWAGLPSQQGGRWSKIDLKYFLTSQIFSGSALRWPGRRHRRRR